jgi:hypothetical protein
MGGFQAGVAEERGAHTMKITSGAFQAAMWAISMMLGACNETANMSAASGQNTSFSATASGRNTAVRGAPGPIAGAGLPILAVGYGVYWLVRRRRNLR